MRTIVSSLPFRNKRNGLDTEIPGNGIGQNPNHLHKKLIVRMKFLEET
ncbi:MAG TPA: hypothetical protein VJC15_04415 [Candidatus Paceibacterota bacterium]